MPKQVAQTGKPWRGWSRGTWMPAWASASVARPAEGYLRDLALLGRETTGKAVCAAMGAAPARSQPAFVPSTCPIFERTLW